MLPGETLASGASAHCDECGTDVELAVHQSAAGYYVGTWCECGPYSRETDYLPTRETAERMLLAMLDPTEAA